ncbi:hypothetical protein [Flavicella marina]|uniref:hypothetical protein n=1 Tax=Flavicella marina TaxID=1475951 RepID=UPI0012657AD5|nr:hypothetical protein [Flavicella marina]
MHKKVEEYIEKHLNTIAILDEAGVGYENVEILNYNTHHENGNVFKNQKDELYGIAILNAVTAESAQKISRELKNNKSITVAKLKELVEKHYLKCLVTENSAAYNDWKKGDKGVASFTYDDLKKAIIPSFTKETS